jgi:two-component system sensor histidine kinase DegS
VASPLFAGDGRAFVSDVAGIEEEFRRVVARELHDRVAQTLTGMLVEVENFKAEEVGWADVVRQMDKVQSSTRNVLQNLRQMLHDLRGEETIEGGLLEAVSALADRFTEQTGVAVEVTTSPRWPTLLTRQASLNLFRIIEEALANVRMHSDATHVKIRFEPYSESEVSLVVQDDGRGVDTDLSRPMGLGTVGMKERAVLLGGRLAIHSGWSGPGTTIRAEFPRDSLVPNEVSPSTEILIRSEVSA